MNEQAQRERDHWNSVAVRPALMRAAVAGSESESEWADVDATVVEIERALQVKSSGRYVELGCGPGRLLAPLAERNPEASWWGVDIADQLLRLVPSAPNVATVLNDGRSIPLDRATVDGVYCVTVFQHVAWMTVQKYLREAGRVLAPGGRLYFQYVRDDPLNPNYDSFLNHAHHDAWIPEAVERAGLRMVELRHDTTYAWTWITAEVSG